MLFTWKISGITQNPLSSLSKCSGGQRRFLEAEDLAAAHDTYTGISGTASSSFSHYIRDQSPPLFSAARCFLHPYTKSFHVCSLLAEKSIH